MDIIERLEIELISVILNSVQNFSKYFPKIFDDFFENKLAKETYDEMKEIFLEKGKVTEEDVGKILVRRKNLYKIYNSGVSEVMWPKIIFQLKQAKLRKKISDVFLQSYHESENSKNIENLLVNTKMKIEQISDELENTDENESLKKSYKRFKEEAGKIPNFLRTGYDLLDQKFSGGLNPKRMYVIAARPGMGKTAFVLNILKNLAEKQKNSICYSLEMHSDELTKRILANVSSVPLGIILKNKKTGSDWEENTEVEAEMDNIGKHIFFESKLFKLDEIIADIYKKKAILDIKMVVIDYIQLMEVSSKSNFYNRQNEIATITRKLKMLSLALDIPIIILSQLSRNVENRLDKRPMLADLRESGAIEQDADAVIFLYRDSYYKNKDAQVAEEPEEEFTELIIAKNRIGSTGVIPLGWTGRFLRFSNASEELIKKHKSQQEEIEID